jgi:CheY-like chemotaxis protein
MKLLIVEDHATDLRLAADVAKSLGVLDVEARTSASAAKNHLDAGLEGDATLPDIIVLDLDLGYESGYELLRFWHGNPKLAGIRMLVWTVMGEEQREICAMFKVDAVVPKSGGTSALKEMLAPLVAPPETKSIRRTV